MLKEEVKQYITEQESNPKNEGAAIFKEEKEYAGKISASGTTAFC